VVTTSDTEIRRILQRRSEAVVDGWYRAVKSSALAARSPAELRRVLAEIFEKVVAFLVSEQSSPSDARSIGASFISLRVQSKAVGRIPGVLTGSMLDDLPDDARDVIEARLPDLIAGITSGLYTTGTQELLEEQEEIRAAYARALRAAEEELRVKDAGIESSINAILMVDMDACLTYVNPAFLEMWGYEDDRDVLGRHVSEFGDWEGRVEQTVRFLSEHGGWVGEVVAERADGSQFDVQASVALIRDEAGDPTQLMVFFVDVTERKRTQEALERRASHATFLNRISEQIYESRAVDDVLQKVVRLTQETFGYDQVAVLTVDRETNLLVGAAIASATGWPTPDCCRIPLGEGITGWVAEHGRMLAVGDVSAEPRYVKLMPRPEPTRSELAVPIFLEGEVVAVLDLQSSNLNTFEESDRVLMRTLADQISAALENARLYEALQQELAQRRAAEASLRRNVRRLETLRDLDQAILIAKSAEEVARAALRHLRRLIPCQRASIDLFDFEKEEITVLVALQAAGEEKAPSGTSFPLTQRSPLFDTLGDSRSVIFEGIDELPQSSPLIRTLRANELRSFILAPIGIRQELIGFVSLGSHGKGSFKPGHKPIIEEVADSVAIAIQQARLLDSIRDQRERLRDAMARLAEAEEAERRAVVRAMHDRVGQNLTALDLNLSTIRGQLDDHDLPDVCSRLEHALSLVEQTTERIRRLMEDLRPPVLDDYGVLAALHWYAGQFFVQTGIGVDVRGDEDAARDLPAHVQNALFRIAQEALNNIAKHAHATDASVSLVADESTVRLAISDDGVGFDQEELGQERSSWGLLTMRERAESLGAKFAIESNPGEGTSVVVEVLR
jgi:PAS domain S-box-containing protein